MQNFRTVPKIPKFCEVSQLIVPRVRNLEFWVPQVLILWPSHGYISLQGGGVRVAAHERIVCSACLNMDPLSVLQCMHGDTHRHPQRVTCIDTHTDIRRESPCDGRDHSDAVVRYFCHSQCIRVPLSAHTVVLCAHQGAHRDACWVTFS